MSAPSSFHQPASLVLVVEDNDADADTVIDALIPAVGESNVVHCSRLSQAVERIKQGDVNAVLLDLSLPDASGLMGLHKLRELAPTVPVLVLTGLRDDRLCAQALHDGAQDYLVKGDLDTTSLAYRVRDSLERQRHFIRTATLAEEQSKRAAAEEASGRAQWLADAGRLVSSSLELEATLRNIEQAAVSRLADLCSAKLTEVSSPGSAQPSRAPRNGDALEGELHEMVIPLSVANRVVGTLSLGRSAASASFNEADQKLIDDWAALAALALENALLYRRAKTAVALRDEFLSIASHELRTPLSTLQMQLELMQIKLRDQAELPREEQLQRLAKCAAQTLRLSRLVDTLLDVSLIASGHIALQRERLDLRAVVRETIERFHAEASSPAGGLSFEAGDAVHGHWDRLRIEQVLTNLFTNGVKYGGGRPVLVELLADATHAELRVRDAGIGIDPAALSRIFNKFERAAPARNYSGLGLGLYVTRQIVEAHGGTVTAESSLGKGSLFTVRLPLGAPASAVTA